MEVSSLTSRAIPATTMSRAGTFPPSCLLSSSSDQSMRLGSFHLQWAAFRIQTPSLAKADEDESCRRSGYCVARTQAQNSRRQTQRGGTQRVRLPSSNGAAVDSRAARQEVSRGQTSGRLYFNVTGFPFPLGPFLERKTLRYEVSTHWKPESALRSVQSANDISSAILFSSQDSVWSS